MRKNNSTASRVKCWALIFRSLVTLVILSAVVMSLNGCSSSKPKVDEDATPGEIRIYEVFGMDCPGCHGGLVKLVMKIPGVYHATANWEEKKLTVTVIEGAELVDDSIYDAITRSNFTAGERLQ